VANNCLLLGDLKCCFPDNISYCFLISNPMTHQCVRIVRILRVSCEFMCIREMEVKELSF